MSEPPDIVAAFNVYAPALRRAIGKLVAPDDVDDVLSDVFVDAWRRRHAYEDRGFPLSSWLFQIAHSRAVDMRRRYARNRTVGVDVDRVAIPGPEEEVEQRLRQQWVRECITTYLTGDQRRVLWLRFVADQTLAETARRLGLSEGAVKALQARAIAKLRTAMAPDDMPSMMAAFAAADGAPHCAVEGCAGRPGKRSGLCKSHRFNGRLSTRVVAKTQPCHAPSCTEYAKFSDGYCYKHHSRSVRRAGDISDPVRNADRTCRAEGCDRVAYRTGLCMAHYARQARSRQRATKPCRSPGCDRPCHARGYCVAHFEEMRVRRRSR